MGKNYSVILPAYNEAENISRTLGLLLKVDRVGEVVVVDDGSTDETKNLVSGLDKTRLVVNKINLGKTRSVQKGVMLAKYDDLVFFDADLLGIRKLDVDEMLDRYEAGSDMVIMDKGSQAYLMREVVRCVPALSGVRVLSRRYFEKIAFKKTDKFELEMRINDYFLENDLKVLISPAPYVYDLRKYKKYPFVVGAYLDIKAVKEVVLMYGLTGLIDLLKKFRIFYNMKI